MDNKGLLAIIAVLLFSFFFILAMDPDKERRSENYYTANTSAEKDSAAVSGTVSLPAAYTASYDSP